MKKLLFIGLLTASTSAFGALAIDVKVSSGLTGSTGATNLNLPAFSTSGGNEVLFVLAANGGAGIMVSSITTAGLNWQKVGFSSQTASGSSAEIWRSSTSAALTSVVAMITETAASIGGLNVQLISFTGADLTGTNGAGAVGAVNGQNNASANSHAPSCTVTTTRDQSFVIAAMGDFDARNQYTASAGQTIDSRFLAGSNDTEQEERTTTNVSGLTLTTLSYTDAATTDGTAFFCAEIKAAVAAAATTVCPSILGSRLICGH